MGLLNKMISPDVKNRDISDDAMLVLDRKSVSRIIASALLIGFFIFVAGYFLGKKKAIETFASKVEHESFADQITYSLNTLYDEKQPHTIIQEVEVEEDAEAELVGMAPQVPEQMREQLAAKPKIVAPPAPQPKKSEKMLAPTIPGVGYQAQLVGGTRKNVQAFAERLAKYGIAIEVKRRSGKTAQGTKIIWHQGVSAVFDNKNELEQLIERIKKLEKIGDVRIIELK